MRRSRTSPVRQGRLALAAVAAILGFLVVVQLRSAGAAQGLAGLSAQELTVLVANLSTRNAQLREEIDALGQQVAELSAGEQRGDSSLDSIREDLARVRAWTGLAPLRGPGVAIRVEGDVSGDGVGDLLNELRNAGAEGLAIGDIRIVTGIVVTGPPGELSIAGRAIAGPLVIRAVGSPEVLTGSLTRVGGPIALLAARFQNAVVDVVAADELELPATDRTLVPAHGQPRI